MLRNRGNTVLIAIILFLLIGLAGGVYVALRPQLLGQKAAGPQCTTEIATCSWNAVDGATSYQYQIYGAGAPLAGKSGFINAGQPLSVPFTPQQGVQYKCEIEPINSCGSGSPSIILGAPGGPAPGSSGICPVTPTPVPNTPTPTPATPTPTPRPSTPTPIPTPTPSGQTPTPTPSRTATPTPTPTPSGQTPTPTPSGQTPTPTPTPSGQTPTPTPSGQTPTPTPTPAPNTPWVDIKADGSDGPITVQVGSPATLTWTSQNASSCTASGAWSGSKATAGTEQLSSVTNPGMYIINCNGANDSVIINVVSAEGIVSSITPSPSPVSTALPSAASLSPTVLMSAGAAAIIVIGALLFLLVF